MDLCLHACVTSTCRDKTYINSSCGQRNYFFTFFGHGLTGSTYLGIDCNSFHTISSFHMRIEDSATLYWNPITHWCKLSDIFLFCIALIIPGNFKIEHCGIYPSSRKLPKIPPVCICRELASQIKGSIFCKCVHVCLILTRVTYFIPAECSS